MKKPKQMQFIYGGEVYTYELYLGGVKRLNLRIRPDGSIRMSAPRLTSQREIDTFLTRYGDRIAAAVARARQKTPPDISLSSSKQELKQKKRTIAVHYPIVPSKPYPAEIFRSFDSHDRPATPVYPIADRHPHSRDEDAVGKL